jgi:flagellar hook protein FlgE
MIRSMSSAISGMKNHQLMLDVISNDISNVSTSGFKASNVVFSDVLSQTLTAGDPNGVVAGTNPAQVGLGARLAATTQTFSQGALQRTGRSTDMAIEGEGFFVIENGTDRTYTRGGALSLDASGNLATNDGGFVMGWQADANGVVNPAGPLSRIVVPIGSALPPNQTTSVTLSGNLSAAAALNTEVTTSFTAYTDQGATVQVNLIYKKTAANQWTVSASHGSPATAITLTDNVLTFGNDGEITAPADKSMNVAAGQIPGITVPVDFELGATGATNRVTQFGGSSTVGVVKQDGALAGSLKSFSVSNGGAIQGVYSNGKIMTVGQVGMAMFANSQGLERVAGGWRETGNSGIAQVAQASTGGRGGISAGTLEMSNVDLAEEFSRLIVAQRGFQGNARVISASDEILQEVVRIGR